MKITIVNMIQPSLSGETNHDTEPNIAVNPANVQQIAGTAFSPDPMGGSQGPVYRSTDEGNTWDELDSFPTQTLDQTLRFAGNSNRLYAAYVDTSYNLDVVKKDNLASAGLTTNIYTKAGYVYDQPYIAASSVMGGSGANSDRVYVGGNDFTTGASKTSSIVQSMDAGAAAPVFATVVIEKRSTSGQDGPQVRTAIHLDGTVYAIFYGWRSALGSDITADVVIVRDDNWGDGANPYSALADPSDSVAGKKIASSIQFIFSYLLGNQRTAGDLSIAVDPRDSSIVYVAWAELLSSVYTLHLVRSTDKGATWSSDLLTITNATHPCLAVNSQGKIGFLYQQITGTGSAQRWETHFRSSTDGITWDDTLLCSALNQGSSGAGPLGDYTHIMAAGKNFYGIFPADNTPDLANFPATATVIYNRNHNFVTKQLLANNGTTPVPSSVDPFFFKIEEMAPEKDFYIRDWTNSPSDHDSGQEPSTYPWFYAGSDVWNRNTNTPGTFVNDQPQTDPVNAGTGSVGDNFAFARISRNNANTAETVNAEFLFANYGLGIPYASLGTPFPVPFAMGDLQQIISLPWHLDPTASDHCCLAVQINSADDPFIAPGLLGYSPGWPTGDLMVINDNNKAQRNLGVTHVMLGMTSQQFVRVRNAAFYTRDMRVRYDVPAAYLKQLKSAKLQILGSQAKNFRSGDELVLKGMKPGENRWIGVSLDSFTGKEGSEIPINFYEMKENQVVNGCTVLLKLSPLNDIIRAATEAQLSLLNRMRYGFQLEIDDEAIDLLGRLLKSRLLTGSYVKYATVLHLALKKAYDQINVRSDKKTGLNLDKEFRVLGRDFSTTELKKVLSAHSIVLQKLDLLLTMRLLEEGDLACILSNVLWQRELYSSNTSLRRLKSSARMLEVANRFIEGYRQSKVTVNDYPKLIGASMGCFNETAKSIRSKQLKLPESIAKLNENMSSLRKLQKAHYEFLSQLSDYFEN
jgi:hypothetical protein